MLRVDEATLAIVSIEEPGMSEADFWALREARVTAALADGNLDMLAALIEQDKKNLDILKAHRTALESNLSNILRLQQYCDVLP